MAGSFNVLGPLQVLIDGIDVTPRAPKERSLLALMVMSHGQVVSADRMIDELWPNLAVDRARRVLWVRIAGLRKSLQRANAAPLLQLVSPGYRLAVDSAAIDAERFFELDRRARSHRQAGDRAAASEILRDALTLWRGEPLADAQGCVSLETEARNLAEIRLDAIEDWIDDELACGRHVMVQGELSRLVAAHLLRERLCRLYIVCLCRAGRRADALMECQSLSRRLADELGVEPSPELTRLEQRIQGHEPSLVDAKSLPTSLPTAADMVGSDGAGAVDRRSGVDRVACEIDEQGAPRPAAVNEEAPAIRAAAHNHNLPVAVTRFVGRAAELNEVGELLGSSRLVTLTGVGGVGKTRLALEAARFAFDRFPDGIWLVELAPVVTDAAVPSALTAALGLMTNGLQGPEAVTRFLAGYMATRRTLLIVDNADHVLDGVARLVHPILASSPGVTVLATSREHLHLPGETAFAVPPLSLPPPDGASQPGVEASDAMTLFCERARAARPLFAMTEANTAVVARVCHQLDGIPLAIELAAARIRMLSLNEIAQRLADCMALLTAERTTGVPARHLTLRATFEWSHQLLTPGEQAALRLLAIFPGEFDLSAALAMIEQGTEEPGGRLGLDGLALIERLVDKSFVEVVEAGHDYRYRLLETIRQYAAEKLAEAGETEFARSRCRDVFLARPGPLWPLMTAQKRQQIYVDRENFRAALEWSWNEGNVSAALELVAIQSVSWMCTGDAQGIEWLERVLAEPEPAVHPARVRALAGLAISLHDSGQAKSSRVDLLLRQAAALAERVGDAGELAACSLTRVEVELAWGRMAEARSLAESALEAYEGLGARAGVGWCHHCLGWIAVAEDDHLRARAHFEHALELARDDAGDAWLLPHALAALAPLTVLLGNPHRALVLAGEAVAAARPFAVRAVLAMALVRATEAAIVADDCRTAETWLVELLRLLLDLGTRRWAADALEMVTVVLDRRDDHVRAVIALGASEALRAASSEQGGGVRALVDEVRRSVDHLRYALGADQFAARKEHGRALSPEAAMTEMHLALGARPGAGSSWGSVSQS